MLELLVLIGLRLTRKEVLKRLLGMHEQYWTAGVDALWATLEGDRRALGTARQRQDAADLCARPLRLWLRETDEAVA